MGYFLLILVVLFIRCKTADCKRSYGLLISSQSWEYIDRFCFVSEIGNLHFIFMYPVDYQVESLYLYYDTASQWNAVYGKNLVRFMYFLHHMSREGRHSGSEQQPTDTLIEL
uniref:Secreted protein n=1 Tax=Parascaris equorum TaxID=6256 RepID=A0A914SB16_PAREQ